MAKTWQEQLDLMEPDWFGALVKLTSTLGYKFNDADMLRTAFVHSSAAKAEPLKSLAAPWNERFEFLGDAVLGLTISEWLLHRYPEVSEGPLSKMRAAMVSREGLMEVANYWDIADYLFLGKGVLQARETEVEFLAADACEALIGAVYLDGGWQNASDVVGSLYEPFFRRDDLEETLVRDYKTQLQELTQAHFQRTPEYRISRENDRHESDVEIAGFVAEVWFNGERLGRGLGRTKKKASQEGAKQALSVVEYLLTERQEQGK